MARPILPFMDFSGGLNVETSNEKLNNNECTVLQNADLATRGSVKRRTGRTKVGSITGKGQGMFFYYRSGQDMPDILAAVSGRLYRLDNGVPVEITITDNGSPFAFQDTLPIEAVQYRENLFVATGTKIVEVTYDEGWTAKTVVPYKPTVLEVINIGTNAIAGDPATWIQGKDGATVSIEGITTSIPQGAVNAAVTFTAHVVKPANVEVGYRFSYRKTGSGSFGNTITTDNNYTSYTFNEVGGYDIKAETTQKVFLIDNMENLLWTASPGRSVQLSTGDLDGYTNIGKSLIILPGAGTVDNTKPTVYRDYATPMDFSKANKLRFAFSQYNTDDIDTLKSTAQSNQIWLYTEGNLDTPILKINGIEFTGKMSNGPLWNLAETSYDNSIVGMDKIVRIGFYTDYVGPDYVPKTGANAATYDVTQDSCSRLDNIEMYMSGTETSYTLTDFRVGGVVDPATDPETYSAIHTSRVVRLHHDRLILAKDNKYPGQIYISDLNNPRYFPTNKRLDFSLDRKEGITAITRFKDYLVIFTKTTISVLTGTGPQDGEIPLPNTYEIKMIHDRIGCIADRSAKVVGNEIFFLGDDGLYSLNPNENVLSDLSVNRIDDKIRSLVRKDPNASAMVWDNQYWICFPSTKEILRMYYRMGAWVQDKSNKLNIVKFLLYTDNAYNLTDDGNIYLHDDSYQDDNETYELVIRSKYFDLASSFNFKKLKRLFVMARHYAAVHVPVYVRVWSDAQLVLDPTEGKAVVVDNYVEWVTTTTPNMTFHNHTVLGDWELGASLLGEVDMSIHERSVKGKGKRVRVGFTHSENGPCEIIGYGIEFKPKKA